MANRKSSAPAFDVSALPETATQYRLNNGGSESVGASAYRQATRALAAWGKASGNSARVHALVHLGWCSGSGARAICNAAGSAAWKRAVDAEGLPLLEAGEPAAPQVVATLTALAEAGAPAEHLATVWATFTAGA